MSQGREAAILAASAFVSHLFCTSAKTWGERLSRAVAYANAEVYQQLRGDGGTTLSAVVISRHDGALLCHVGDSRIYGISSDRVLEQLSRDDTFNALLNRRDGELDDVKDSRLLQFVGMGDEMEAQISFIPNHFRSLLLTSDGAHDVPQPVLQRLVTAAAGGSDLIRKLLLLSDMMGGRDNASAILLPIGGEADPYFEPNESELLAIFPNDTLSIYIAESSSWERSKDMRTPSPENSQLETNQQGRSSSLKDHKPNNELKSKPTTEKVKARTAKPRKSKHSSAPRRSDAPDLLPLEGSNNKVEVQFSSPESDEDKP